ncbi:hypothetical protein VNO77_02834 [Canavalia gladiata]|uniref:Uncharacterized protein n=1 Tax=Canavalia gladiata TaxID=3824 RepID=A0AAN9MZA5_CANGL
MNSAPHLPRSSGERLDGLAGDGRAGARPRVCSSRSRPNREVPPFKIMLYTRGWSYDARPLHPPELPIVTCLRGGPLRLRSLTGVDGLNRASPEFPLVFIFSGDGGAGVKSSDGEWGGTGDVIRARNKGRLRNLDRDPTLASSAVPMSSHDRKVNPGTHFTPLPPVLFPSHLLTVRPCTLREAMNV